MCLEFALKKGGLSIIRNFIQSTAGIQTYFTLHSAPSPLPSATATKSATS